MNLILFPFMKTKDFFLLSLSDGKKSHKAVIIVVILGFLVRTGICFFTNLPNMHTDSYGYFEQAESILKSGYINYFPNGYPFIIAFLRLLSEEQYVTMLLWLNILMSTCSIYFVYDISRKIFNNNQIAFLASLILAFFPTQINYVRWLLTEVPTTFFLLGFYFFFLRKKNWSAGLFFGIATVVRTEVLPILILVMFFEFLFYKRVRIAVVTAFLIPVLSISSYCYLKTGQFSMAGHSKVNVMYSITSSGGYVDWYYQDKHPEVKTTGQAVKMYVDYMKENPLRYIKNRLANLWELWGFFPSSSEGSRGLSVRLFIGGINFFLIIFGLAGWWKNRRTFIGNFLIAPFIIVTIVHTLLLTLPRYTYTVEPFLIILAAYSVNVFFLRRIRVNK